MDLNIIVAEKTQELIDSGAIEKMIVDNIEKTIKAGVESALREYSSFGKDLSEKISESINQSSRHISLPNYNKLIAGIVSKQYSKVLKESAVENLNKLIGEQIITVKAEDDISSLFEKIEELWTTAAYDKGIEYISVDYSFNDEESILSIEFKHPEYNWHDVKIVLFNHGNKKPTWHIGIVYINEKQLTGHPISTTGTMLDDVANILYQYYAMETNFTLDVDIEDIYVGRD